MRKTNQDGIAHIGLIVVFILVVALVAFAFWRIQDEATNGDSTEQSTTSEVEQTEPIEDASELEAIEAELQATDIDDELGTDELDEVIQ